MNTRDILWLSYRDLGEKKIRTALTVLMVMIGVASIIALVSQTEGISSSIQSALQSLGPTSIILTSTRATGFTIADTAAILTLPNISTVIPILTGQASFVANNQNSSVSLIGVTPEGLQQLLGGVNLYEGAVYEDSVAPSALVGHSVAFPSTTAGRQNVFVGVPATLQMSGRGGATYTVPVVGILQSYGASLISVDGGVVISLSAAEALLHRSSFNTILVKASSTGSVAQLSQLLTNIYGSNARILTTQQLAQTASSIIGSISLLLVVIAGISLLVAAIGIMNIMLIAVFERTHEIGILKALGFKNRHVMIIFLFQALIIGVIGGALGLVLGSGASYSLAYIITHAQTTNTTTTGAGGQFRGGGGEFGGSSGAATTTSGFGSSSISYQPVFTLSTMGTALIVAVLVSAIAGIYPAWRASRMEPIDALRQL